METINKESRESDVFYARALEEIGKISAAISEGTSQM